MNNEFFKYGINELIKNDLIFAHLASLEERGDHLFLVVLC